LVRLTPKTVPLVTEVAPKAKAVWVVRVSQFQTWAKLALAMVLVAVAAVMEDRATAEATQMPPVRQTVPPASGKV